MASIYAQIGGHEALESVVADFYDRVLADDEPGTSGPRDHHSPLHSCRRASRVMPGVPDGITEQILAAISPLRDVIATGSSV